MILTTLAARVRRVLEAKGTDLAEVDEGSLAQAYAAATTARGTEKHAPEGERDDERNEELAGQVILPARRKARVDGFDLDAEVAVRAHDEVRLEALCRYLLRPPIALDSLRYLRPHLVVLELKPPWRDGTTHVSMTPSAFLARLASLVPRPRKNTTLYYGVLAGHADGREKLVPAAPRKKRPHEDHSWAKLMQHSFGLDVLGCRRCKGRMKLVAVFLDRKEVRRLLRFLGLFSDPLPVHPARGPPDEPDAFDFP